MIGAHFQLRMAIGHRYVIMDNVFDIAMPNLNKNLQDYLDGYHEVILERKNFDPVEQNFPPGRIKTNEVFYSQGLEQRYKEIKLVINFEFVIAHERFFQISFSWNVLLLHNYLFTNGHFVFVLNACHYFKNGIQLYL